jgi:hypothetical protein
LHIVGYLYDLQKNIPSPLLIAIIKICDNNKIKIKLDTTLTQPIKIKEFNRLPTFTDFISQYINKTLTEWREAETKGIKISK